MPNKTSQINLASTEFQSVLTRAILAASPDGVLVVNDQGIVVYYNCQFIEVWGLPRGYQAVEPKPDIAVGAMDEPILLTATKLVKNPKSFLARVKKLYDHPELSDHCELELKDGRTLERYSSALYGESHQYLGRVWFFRDITAKKKTENKLVKLIHCDPLTNIANRRCFFERSNQELIRIRRYPAPLCIASMDIDLFKCVNDNFGHAAGDEMLKSICHKIQSIVRHSDLFARMGGEEFVILMPNIDMKGAFHLAERVRQAIAKHRLSFNNQDISCTISIGVAEFKPTDSSIDDCLNRADKALYLAKENGRNRVETELDGP